MVGIVVPEAASGRLLEILSINTDKNYLTPAEIAAFADNHLATISRAGIEQLLTGLGLDTEDEDAVRTITHALAIANYTRELSL